MQLKVTCLFYRTILYVLVLPYYSVPEYHIFILQVGRLSQCINITMFNKVLGPKMIHFPLAFLKERIVSWFREARTVITALLGTLTRREASFLQRMIPRRSTIYVAIHTCYIERNIASLMSQVAMVFSSVAFITGRLVLLELIESDRVHAGYRTACNCLLNIRSTTLFKSPSSTILQHEERIWRDIHTLHTSDTGLFVNKD